MTDVAQDRAGSPILISACLIVRDEVENLERCFSSLEGACDEIVVVDTGSVDDTANRAERLGARVFYRPWDGDFSAARNYAVDQARGVWVLSIDADEELVLEQPEEFRRWLSSQTVEAFMVPIRSFLDSGDSYVVLYERLFRNLPDLRFEGRIHEQLAHALARRGATVGMAPFEIRHYGYLSHARRSRNKAARNVALLTSALQDEPRNWYLHLKLAEELLADGRPEQGLVSAERALATCPEGHPLFERCIVVRAEAAMSCRRFDDGLAVYDRYKHWPRRTSQFYFSLGRSLQLAGRPLDALAALYTAVAYGDPPGNLTLRMTGSGSYLAWTAIGSIYHQLGDLPKAVAAFREALKARPAHAQAARELTDILCANGVPDEQLEAELTRVDTSVAEAAAAVTCSLLASGRAELALRVLEGSTSPPSNGRKASRHRETLHHFWKGITYVSLGRYDEGARAFQSIPDSDPLGPSARLEEAFCLMMMGDDEGSRAAAERAAASSMEAANAEVLIGLLEQKRGQARPQGLVTMAHHAAAIKLLYRIARTGAVQYLSWWHEVADRLGLPEVRRSALAGKALVEFGHREQGIQELISAARLGSVDHFVYGLLAEHAAETGMTADAEVLTRRARSLNGAEARWQRLLSNHGLRPSSS